MANQSNRLHIDESNWEVYNIIRNEYKYLRLTHSDIFSIALSLGFQQKIRTPLTRKRAIIRSTSLSSDLFSILILLAIEEWGGR